MNYFRFSCIVLLNLISIGAAQLVSDIDTVMVFPLASGGYSTYYVPQIKSNIYFQFARTTSCPAQTMGDFIWYTSYNNMEIIPSVDLMIRGFEKCAGFGDTTYTRITFNDRQYKIATNYGNIYMKVLNAKVAGTPIATFTATLRFSPSQFMTSNFIPKNNADKSRQGSVKWNSFQHYLWLYDSRNYSIDGRIIPPIPF